MNKGFDKYNSVTFQEYFSKNEGQEIYLDYINRLLEIQNKAGVSRAVVHFSNSIKHEINKNELLNKRGSKKERAYYVFENGVNGHDWLWYYGDMISIDELL